MRRMYRCVAIVTSPIRSEVDRLYRLACVADARSKYESALDTTDVSWALRADALVVYYDLGVSEETLELVRSLIARGKLVEMRSLYSWRTESPPARAEAEDLLREAIGDPVATRMNEQVNLLVQARALLVEAGEALVQGHLDNVHRVRLAGACREIASQIAPELTRGESAALFADVKRSA